MSWLITSRAGANRPAVHRALVRFGVSTVVTVLLVGAGTALISRHIAKDEAVRDARTRTLGIAQGIAAPLVNSAVRQAEPEALRVLGAALRSLMQDRSVVHIVLYDRAGTILWADDPALVGSRDPLRTEVLAATAGGGSIATRSEEHPRAGSTSTRKPELIEVYVGATDADGRPFVFEAYTTRKALQADVRVIIGDLLPLTLGSLLLLTALILPLALAMARQIDRANDQRATLLRRSLQAWHHERARIAQTLHDDVIQDLAALSYALPGVLMPLPDTPSGVAARNTGHRLQRVTIESLRTVRGMLDDLVPSGLDGAGLAGTLQSLARRTEDAGLPVRMIVDPDLTPTATVGGLVYRAVREGLQNVRTHAEATRAEVRVHLRGPIIEVEVDDDGRGPLRTGPPEDGHVGLRLLGRLVQDVGGSVELTSHAPRGARLRVRIPAQLPDLEADSRG